MNIHDFQNYINDTILDRGYDYYLDGAITRVFRQGSNTYIFYVQGTTTYEVSVVIEKNGDISDSTCDCPYDFGPICKHEVAAYFRVLDIWGEEVDIEELPDKPTRQNKIHTVLNNLSNQELVNIITNIALEDPIIENSILFTYAKGDDHQELTACQKLIHSIVRKYTGREGFITYRNTGAFVSELGDILKRARNIANVSVAVDVTLLLLEEAIDAISYSDDSSGHIGFLVTESLELLEELVIKIVETGIQTNEVFEKLLTHANHEVFEGWVDWKIDLLQICSHFTDDTKFRKKFTTIIELMIDHDTDDFSTHYSNERLLQILLGLIKNHGTKAEIERFIHDNRQYSSFREKLIKRNFDEKNYVKAIELAKEGELQDQALPGLLSKWRKMRYEALRNLSDKEEQQLLAKKLFLGGDFDYYKDLKELSMDQHDEFYRKLKQELKSSHGWHHTSLFLKLIEEENDVEEMLKFVKSKPNYIEDYAEKLVGFFREDVLDIYLNYLRSVASTSSNRKEYQNVCRKITRYRKIAGRENTDPLINELKALYKRKPAFIDELGKIQT